jgi:hypothetical protein
MTSNLRPMQKPEYTKPEIQDYGSIQDLTAGCFGSPRDFHGKNNALTDSNSRGMCVSSP